MTETINEDGSPVLTEALYYRYFAAYVQECDSTEDALSLLQSGMDNGELSPKGVMVDGECVLYYRGADEFSPPTPAESLAMKEHYTKAKS